MMISFKYSFLGIAALVGAFVLYPYNAAFARDDQQTHSIAAAMATGTALSFSNVKFFFGDQSHPKVEKTIGTYTTKRTTNAFGKSDAAACQWVFLSAVKSLYERALQEGGNAVVNIQSVTTGKSVSDMEEYICRAGTFVAKVYLQGNVVSLK